MFKQCGLHSTGPGQVSVTGTYGGQQDQLSDCQLSFRYLTTKSAVCFVISS